MGNVPCDVETLASFLGRSRSDRELQTFLKQFGDSLDISSDKEDGADTEFIEFRNDGFGFAFDHDKLISIHFHSAQSDPDSASYRLPLPLSICFEQSKDEILSIHGKPDKDGGGCSGFFGPVPVWVIYRRESYDVHIEFAADLHSVKMVTLLLPDPA